MIVNKPLFEENKKFLSQLISMENNLPKPLINGQKCRMCIPCIIIKIHKS